MRFPVLQSFEKDTTKVNFTINQLSRGLDDTTANGEISIATFPGIDLTGATECAAAIQFAINSINAGGLNSQILTIPAGSILKIATTLQIGNGTGSVMSTQQGIRIKGMGMPSYGGTADTPASTPVKFIWSGAAGGIMFSIAGPLVGWGLENLYFDGVNSANLGLDVVSGQFGNCQNLTFSGCKAIGLRLTTFTSLSFPTHGQSNSMHNTFINTWINIPDIAGAIGILLDGSDPGGPTIPPTGANACYNNFINTTLWCANATPLAATASKFALFLRGCDTNHFTNTHCVLGMNSAAVTFDYSVLGSWPGGNILDGIDTAGFAVQFQNNGTVGNIARANYVRLTEVNGAFAPRLDNMVCLNFPEQMLPWAVDSGIADSLVATYAQTFNDPGVLTDGRLVFIRAIATNATANPIFQFTHHGSGSGFAAVVIRKFGNKPLVAGDIQAGAELMLRYNAATPRWELLNPFNAP